MKLASVFKASLCTSDYTIVDTRHVMQLDARTSTTLGFKFYRNAAVN